MPPAPNIASLRESLLKSIGSFLWDEGFKPDGVIQHGIIQSINLIADYHEEGTTLYPEILVTNDLDKVKASILHKEVFIAEAELSLKEFRNAIKLCAPLARNSWIIFIEVKGNHIEYGVISAEITETTPSLYSQVFGELKVDLKPAAVAYIRNVGQKTVELVGQDQSITVSLNLDDAAIPALKAIEDLTKIVTRDCNAQFATAMVTFFEKSLDKTLKAGHGNLIGVVADTPEAIEGLKAELTGEGGVYLLDPIDFEVLIMESEETKSNEASVALKSHASIMKSMLNHDGIAILTTKGKLIGYHILIDSTPKENAVQNEWGGTRTKAFQAMQDSGLFEFCFFKSQDGHIKTWKKP